LVRAPDRYLDAGLDVLHLPLSLFVHDLVDALPGEMEVSASRRLVPARKAVARHEI
jgi:hypothetical protein